MKGHRSGGIQDIGPEITLILQSQGWNPGLCDWSALQGGGVGSSSQKEGLAALADGQNRSAPGSEHAAGARERRTEDDEGHFPPSPFPLRSSQALILLETPHLRQSYCFGHH